MEEPQPATDNLCLLCEGSFVVREGLQYATCPRCNGTGLEPKALIEIRLGISTFYSEQKKGWVTILNVLYSTEPVTKKVVTAIIQDLLDMLEGKSNKMIDLPSKEGKLQ